MSAALRDLVRRLMQRLARGVARAMPSRGGRRTGHGTDPTPRWPRDVALALVAGALLLAWDASALDLPSARLFGSASGFAWRNAWLTSGLLHEGGRALAWLLLGALALDAWRPWLLRASGVSRAARQRALGATLVCLLAVPALKRASHTSCPWELADFGGHAHYVSHWLAALDGGSGHCFPSGHAVAAFAFFSLYFLWREQAPRAARAALIAVLATGTLFGLGQLARGAHYPSHTAWSAWLCWVVCALAFARPQRAAAVAPA